MSAAEAWTPGDGWREHPLLEDPGHRQVLTLHSPDGALVAAWVPDEPVLELPTEIGTTIRVTASTTPGLVGALLHLDPTDDGYPWHGNGDAYPVEAIDGYEPVARPPLAADALQAGLRAFAMRAFGQAPDETALQYGVELLQGHELFVEQH